jgi:hypothetical protein
MEKKGCQTHGTRLKDAPKKHTLQVRLEGILGGLETLLGLEPDEAELVLDIVDHDSLIITTILTSLLSGGVGTGELKVLVLLLEVLAAVSLPEDGAVLGGSDLEGVGEHLVSGDQVLEIDVSTPAVMSQRKLRNFQAKIWADIGYRHTS